MQMIVLVQINVTLDAKNGFASQEWKRCVFSCTVLAHVTLNKKVLSLPTTDRSTLKLLKKTPQISSKPHSIRISTHLGNMPSLQCPETLLRSLKIRGGDEMI